MDRCRSAYGLPAAIRAKRDQSGAPTADCGEVQLLVVEMGDAHLSRAPGFMPRVSWCMWGMNDEDEPVTGGPAPSFEDAMLRAELALRAHLGVKMDS